MENPLMMLWHIPSLYMRERELEELAAIRDVAPSSRYNALS